MLKIKDIVFDNNIINSILVKSIQKTNSPTKQIVEQFQTYDEYYRSLGPE